MNNITGLNNFYIPNTLDGLNGVESSIAGSSLLLDGSNSMLNNLNVGTHKLINVVEPTASSDGATKNYVDTSITTAGNTYLKLNGSNAMTNDLNVGTHKLINVTEPTLSTDGATKNYTDTSITAAGNTYLKLNGSNAMTSDLNVGTHKLINVTEPTIPTDGATKNYTDTSITTAGNTYLKLNGSNSMTSDLNVGTHKLINVTEPTIPTDGATKNYTDTSITTAGNTYLKLNGSNSMTSDLNVGTHKLINVTEPTIPTDGATKNYTDTSITAAGNTYLKLNGSNAMTNNLNMNSKLINLVGNGLIPTDGVNKGQMDNADNLRLKLDGTTAMTNDLDMGTHMISNLSTATPTTNQAISLIYFQNASNALVNNYLPLSGGTMLNNINMNSKLINSLGNAILGTDAVNKSQMDTADGLKINSLNGVGTGQMTLTHTNTQLKLVNTNTTQQTGNIVIQSILSGSVDFWDSNGLTSASIQSSSADRTMILSGAGVPSVILSSTLVKLLKQTQITGGLKMISGELDMNALNITNTSNIHSNGTNPIYLNNSGAAKVKIDSSGLTMQNSGNIDMAGNNLSNVNIISSPATTPLYISNSNVANCVFNTSGLVMSTGKNLNMNGNYINFLQSSITAGDAVNRGEIANSLIPLISWRSGEIIQTILNGKSLGQVLFNSSIPKDITGSLAAGANASIFYAMSFTPKSTSSTIYVSVDGSCTMSGTGSDQFKAYLGKYVGTTTTSYMLHNCYTTAQGGLRGVSVFPITACWSNTTLTSYTIGCYFDTNDMDDNIIFNDEFNIKIQEIKN